MFRKISCIIFCMAFLLRTADANVIPTPKVMKTLSGTAHSIVSIEYRESSDSRIDHYTLSVKEGRVTITGHRGYAMETLRQITASDGTVNDTFIEDWATFKLRGFMHDVGRNFRPVEMIKEDLKFIAAYKLNVFHFHLTDHPAWRIECRCHPELNDPKFQRKGRDEGKFYTYDQIRELIAFAKELGITIIPEIDMPGHSRYFTDTFGFTMDSPQGMKILGELMAEFFAEIPAKDCPYFHIGSDEIHIEDKEGFMHWAESLARRYGRETIAWDPGLPADSMTIRQIWNEAAGDNAAAAEKPGRFLDSYMGYLNYYDPIGFVNRVFLHRTPDRNPYAMGGILCLWNDVRVEDKSKTCPHNGMETGVMVFAERMWNGGGYSGNSDITPSPSSDEGRGLAEFEKRMAYHRDNLVKGRNIRWVANSEIGWKITAGDETVTAWGGTVNLDRIIATKDTTDCIAEAGIFAASDTIITALVGFEAAARSNRISGGIGPQGHFENKGRLFVNGTEIFPASEWKEPGKYHYEFNTWARPEEEQPYTDEQFYWMRKPVSILLHKGWNRVIMSTPRTFIGQRWTFAFIPVTLHDSGGLSEATGISYRQWETNYNR